MIDWREREGGDPAFISSPRHLLKPLDQPLALQPGQPPDPEHPVELIDLMLVADRAQALRFLGSGMAVDIVIADPQRGHGARCRR